MDVFADVVPSATFEAQRRVWGRTLGYEQTLGGMAVVARSLVLLALFFLVSMLLFVASLVAIAITNDGDLMPLALVGLILFSISGSLLVLSIRLRAEHRKAISKAAHRARTTH